MDLIHSSSGSHNAEFFCNANSIGLCGCMQYERGTIWRDDMVPGIRREILKGKREENERREREEYCATRFLRV